MHEVGSCSTERFTKTSQSRSSVSSCLSKSASFLYASSLLFDACSLIPGIFHLFQMGSGIRELLNSLISALVPSRAAIHVSEMGFSKGHCGSDPGRPCREKKELNIYMAKTPEIFCKFM